MAESDGQRGGLMAKYVALWRKYDDLARTHERLVAGRSAAMRLAESIMLSRVAGVAIVEGGVAHVRNRRWRAIERASRAGGWRRLSRGRKVGQVVPILLDAAQAEAAALIASGRDLAERHYAQVRGERAVDLALERVRSDRLDVVAVFAREVTREARRERALGDARQRLAGRGAPEAAVSAEVAHLLANVLGAMALRVGRLRAHDPTMTDRARDVEALERLVEDTAARLTGAGGALSRDEPALAPAAEATGAPRHVIVIDDHVDLLASLRDVLAGPGCVVDACDGGREAIALLRAGAHYDVAFCDVGLPDVDGWDVAREFRARSPDTAVFMLTGWADPIAEDAPERRLVRGVLRKPVGADALRSAIAQAGERADPAAWH